MSKFKEFCDKIALIKNELEKESLRKANAKSSLMGLAQGLKRRAMSMASPGVIGVHMPSGSPAHPGASQAGADLVTGMKSISSGGTDPLGFKDSAKKKHKQTLIQLQAMPVADLPKSEDMEKASFNVRAQRKNVFGSKSQPSAKSPMREKHMEHIQEFAKKFLGLGLNPSGGKIDERTGQRRSDSPDIGVDKPDWRSGKLESQWNPEAAVHELAHLMLLPKGVGLEAGQKLMDKQYGDVQKEHGYMQQKRSQGEVQPMAAEQLIRRAMGLPASQVSIPVKQNAPPRVSLEDPNKVIGTRVQQGRDKQGSNKYVDLIRQSSNLHPEHRQRLQDIFSKKIVFHPEQGWIPNKKSLDAAITNRKPGAVLDRQQRNQSTPNKLAASERNVDKRLASRKPQEPYMKESKHLIMGKPTNPKDPINDYEKNGPKKPLAKTDEKYINVGQGWRDLARHKPSGKMVNPITDSGKSKPTHLNDLESLKATHGRNYIEKQSDKPLKIHGTETYKVHPSGELQFVGAHHDSSDGLNAKMNKVEQELKQAKESKSIGALMKVLAKMEDLQQAEDEKLKKNKYIKSILADVKATNARKLGERNIANDAIRAAKPTTVEPKPKVDTSRPTTLFHPDLSFNRKPDTKIQKTFGLAVTSGPDIVNRGTIKTPMQIDSPVIYNDEGKPKMNDVKQFLKDYKNLRGKKK